MRAAAAKDGTLSALVRALAVAGFAAGNIMMLSVAVWSGADAGSRDLFHWLSAAIALPGARLFRPRLLPFGLAGAAPRPHQHGRADLDRRPAGLRHESLRDDPSRTARLFRRRDLAAVLPADRPHARPRDARARARRPSRGWRGWRRAAPRCGKPTASQRYLPVEDIRPGMTCCWPPAIACRSTRRVVEGRSEIDGSLASGESVPRPVAGGRPAAGRHAQSGGPLDRRGDGRGPGLLPGRDDAHDGSGRGRPHGLSPHRRPRRAALCAGDPCHRASRPSSAG